MFEIEKGEMKDMKDMKLRLDTSLQNYLKRDAKIVRDAREEIKKAKEMYRPEMLLEVVQEECMKAVSERKTLKGCIRVIVERIFKEVDTKEEEIYLNEAYQTTVSNILKTLELVNWNITDEQFEKLLSPMLKVKDDKLDIIADRLIKMERFKIASLCKENAVNKEIEHTRILLNAIIQYIETDDLKVLGGDPVVYKYSSYEEIYLLAKELGFDVEGMDKELDSNNVLIDPEAFIKRKISVETGFEAEESIFDFSKLEQQKKSKEEIEIEKAFGLI